MTYLSDLELEEEYEFFDNNLTWIRNNMKYVLEHLDDGTFWVYKTRFIYYGNKKQKGL